MAIGRKTGGRKPGTPNKVTTEARELFKAMFERLAPEVEDWIRDTARGVAVVKTTGRGRKAREVTVRVGADPGKAADLMLRLAEFHIPKLARTEITGKDGTAVTIEIHKIAAPEPKP